MATTNRLQPAASSLSLEALRSNLQGPLLAEGDPGFDAARRLHNGMIDHTPALIASCTGVADVRAALRFAQERGLAVSVRGGGHGIAGTAVVEGGLVLDMRPMKGIFVDPAARRARAQGGVTWRELDRETQAFGLATTGGAISSTGIAGLTLGGGLGWLMRKHGLACDNLRSAQVVLADGRCVVASEESHPELFWALRGGGGNFGVVTSLEYELHEVGPLLAGMLIHPASATREVLQAYRAFTRTAPDELTAYAALLTAPDGAPVVAIVVCYCGPIAKGEALLQPLIAFGSPLANTIGPMAYTDVQQQLDGAYPEGALNYWRSAFLKDLNDEVIDAAADSFTRVPSVMTGTVFEHLGGAVGRVPTGGTAFPNRSATYNMAITSVWQDPAESAANITWTRELFDAVQPHTAGVYVNYLDEDEVSLRSVQGFGSNYERLQAVKLRYDPENFFHSNANVVPGR